MYGTRNLLNPVIKEPPPPPMWQQGDWSRDMLKQRPFNFLSSKTQRCGETLAQGKVTAATSLVARGEATGKVVTSSRSRTQD